MKNLFMVVLGFLSLLAAGDPLVVNENIKLYPFTDSVFLHCSLMPTQSWGLVECNGLVYIRNGQALLVDTPYNDEQTEQLVRYLRIASRKMTPN